MSEIDKHSMEAIMARLDELESIVKKLTDKENARRAKCTNATRIQDNKSIYDGILDAIESESVKMNVKYENEDGRSIKDSSDEPEYVSIPKPMFDSMVKGMDASPKAFLLWALDKNILLHNDRHFTRVTRMQSKSGKPLTRCVTLRLYIDD